MSISELARLRTTAESYARARGRQRGHEAVSAGNGPIDIVRTVRLWQRNVVIKSDAAVRRARPQSGPEEE